MHFSGASICSKFCIKHKFLKSHMLSLALALAMAISQKVKAHINMYLEQIQLIGMSFACFRCLSLRYSYRLCLRSSSTLLSVCPHKPSKPQTKSFSAVSLLFQYCFPGPKSLYGLSLYSVSQPDENTKTGQNWPNKSINNQLP